MKPKNYHSTSLPVCPDFLKTFKLNVFFFSTEAVRVMGTAFRDAYFPMIHTANVLTVSFSSLAASGINLQEFLTG